MWSRTSSRVSCDGRVGLPAGERLPVLKAFVVGGPTYGVWMRTWDGIAWLREAREFESDYCVTFAKGLRPLELLTRMGCDPTTAAPMGFVDATEAYFDTGVEVIRAGVSHGWAFAVENTGARGFDPDVQAAVSVGTEAVVVYSDVNPVAHFVHARNGEVTCGFAAATPECRFGTDPNLLLPHMIAAGLLSPGGDPPADDDTSPRGCELRMSERAFGLDLPYDLVVHGLLTAAALREGLSEPLSVDTAPARETPGPGPGAV